MDMKIFQRDQEIKMHTECNCISITVRTQDRNINMGSTLQPSHLPPPRSPKKSIQEQQIAKSNHASHRLAITSSPNSNHGSYWWTTTCEKLSFWYLKSVVCKTLTVSLSWWDLSYWRRNYRNYWIWNGPYESKCLFFATFQHYLSTLQTVQLIYLLDTVLQWTPFGLRTSKLFFFSQALLTRYFLTL